MQSLQSDSSLRIEQDGETYVLSGKFDQNAKFRPLLDAKAPLRLDVRGVQAVSSVGVREWLHFLAKWGDKPMEIRGCTPPFVSMVNSVPPAAGPMGRKETIKSVLVPYGCEFCSHYMEAEVQTAGMVDMNGNLHAPDVPCEDCGQKTRLVCDLDEYFVFLIWKPAT